MKREMSQSVLNAIKNMPIHWDNERQRAEYMIANAECFRVSYITQKTSIEEDFNDLEVARQVAKFVVKVGSRLGRIGRNGIVIRAIMGDYDAFVEAHRDSIPDSLANSSKLNANGK